MSIVNPASISYRVIGGKYAGKNCVIRPQGGDGKTVRVVFFGESGVRTTAVPRKFLVRVETPGWIETVFERPYGLKEHFERHNGDGINMLRAPAIAQPRTLKVGDVLAIGETVAEMPRKGWMDYRSSVLIKLKYTGWVEVAPQLPIALLRNENFKLPVFLRKGDILATGCVVLENPASNELDWTTICVDIRDNRHIRVPSCIPLALAAGKQHKRNAFV